MCLYVLLFKVVCTFKKQNLYFLCLQRFLSGMAVDYVAYSWNSEKSGKCNELQ